LLDSSTQEARMPTPFEIVWQLSPDAKPVVLRAVSDANAATIAFGEELDRLRGHAAPGEVLVRSGAGDQPPRLREALHQASAGREQEPQEAEHQSAVVSS
jgi:hypothetical protein